MANREGAGRRSGCLRYGCLGCAGLIALAVIAAGVIAVLALVMEPPGTEMVSPGVTREVPARPGTGDGSASSDSRAPDLPSELRPPGPEGAGRVVLDLSEGVFEMVPGDPGSPIRVDGSYNAGAYELEEAFEEEPGGEWTYRLTFRRSVSWIRLLKVEDEQENRLRITLPRDLPFALEGVVRRGESRMRLGGLSVRELDLRLLQGEHRLEFRAPTPLPMERFAIDASQGNFVLDGLGNASPATLVARGSMGEMLLGLDGAWRNDAEIHGGWRMGELRVRVPAGVHVNVDEIGMFLGGSDTSALRSLAPAPQGAPTLSIAFSGSMGQISVTP